MNERSLKDFVTLLISGFFKTIVELVKRIGKSNIAHGSDEILELSLRQPGDMVEVVVVKLVGIFIEKAHFFREVESVHSVKSIIVKCELPAYAYGYL